VVFLAREFRDHDIGTKVCVEGRGGNGRAADRRSLRVVALFGVIAEKALSWDDTVLVAHLNREVGAWVDRIGLTVGVWDFVHVHFVQDDFDAHATAAVGVIDEYEFAAFAVWELAEEIFVCGALGVDVVVFHAG
jgi:hypothetical protein